MRILPSNLSAGAGNSSVSRFAGRSSQPTNTTKPQRNQQEQRNVSGARQSGAAVAIHAVPTIATEPKVATVRPSLELEHVVEEDPLRALVNSLDLTDDTTRDSGLPAELYQLQDPHVPVALPAPERVQPGQLDNWKLDKLVSALGRDKSTWRRALMLYEWLKECNHKLDDRLCTTLIRVCAEHNDAVSALGVYEWMRAPEEAGGAALTPTPYTYTAAMRAAIAANMNYRALAIWKDAQEARCMPDARMCICYIEVCARMGMADEALEVYQTMRKAPPHMQLTPTVHAYTAAMRAATEGGRWYKALDIWEDMNRAGCEPTGHAYAAVISACAVGMDWMRAVRLFDEMGSRGIKPDVVSCTALITALAAGAEATKAEAVVKWMLAHNLRPNVRTYTALLTALGNAKQWDRAVAMLSLMQQPSWGGVQPNAYTYSALLKSLGEHGQWQLAEAVFSSIEVQVLGKSYGPAIPTLPLSPQRPAAHSSTNVAVPPSALYAPTSPAQLPPSITTSPLYSSPSTPTPTPLAFVPPSLPQTSSSPQTSSLPASSIPSSNNTWTSASQLNGLSLDIHSNRSSLSGVPSVASASATAATPSRKSFSLFASGSATSSTIPSTSTTVPAPATAPSYSNNLSSINSLQQTLFPNPMQSAFQEPLSRSLNHEQQPQLSANGYANPSSRPQPRRPKAENQLVNEVVCGALMLAYERAGKWAEAVSVLVRAVNLGLTPNTVMYNTAISAAGKAGQLEVAEKLFGKVQKPDAVTFETLIAAYGMAGLSHKAEAMFAAMQQAGFQPRDYAYCGLIAAYSMSGNFDAAMRVRGQLKRDKVPLTVHVFNSLLAACERAGQFDKGLELFNSMKGAGVEPNAVTQQLLATIARQGVQSVESQQAAAAAISAALAAAGTYLVQTGAF